MNRTLIYARVSTEDQVEKYGLPVQLRACREYAASHGLSVNQEITDDGISGAILERPGLTKVRNLIREQAADVVLMLDVDRLSRELAHLLILKPEIEKSARLEFVAAKFEDSPSGRMFFGIRGVIGQYERELTRERTMRGQRERATHGLIVGGRIPYGYSYDAGALAAAEPQAATVRNIYSWYQSGLSIRGIAQKLQESGIPSWSGQPWGHTSVRWILGNETYAGRAWWGVRYRDGHTLRPKPADAHIALMVPALIDHALWEQVQARLAEHAERSGRPSDRLLLSGLLHCGCGRRMHGEFHRKRNYTSYRCAGRDRENGFACQRTVNGSQLDRAVWSEVVRVFGDGDELERMLDQHQESLRQTDAERPEQLRAQIARAKRREQAAMELLLDPDLAPERAAIKAQYQQARAERVRAEAELSRVAAAQSMPESSWIHETAAQIRQYIGGLVTAAERREVVKRLANDVQWDGEQATIRCFIGPEWSNMPRHSEPFPSLQLILTARLAA